MGVGEFLDLIPLVRWAARAGLRLVQLLPVNDTSMYGDWRDSYPYKSAPRRCAAAPAARACARLRRA